MPHDMHGNRIEVGDIVKAKPYNQKPIRYVVGPVVEVVEAQSCSGQIMWFGIGEVKKDYFGADESEIVLKADGSIPQPPKDS